MEIWKQELKKRKERYKRDTREIQENKRGIHRPLGVWVQYIGTLQYIGCMGWPITVTDIWI